MHSNEDRSDALLPLVLRALRERRAVCALMLAVYRVELTALLQRMAGEGAEQHDAGRIYALAERIARTAEVAPLAALRSNALVLQRRAAAADDGDERTASAVLAAGLDVIDAILDAARANPPAANPGAGLLPN